jgi:drug/metabolite transporter (DMT)-like permease
MSRRGAITVAMIVVGIGLMVLAYFAGAAPWCVDRVECSNPRWEWAAGVFVLGILMALSAPVVYSVSKDRRIRR